MNARPAGPADDSDVAPASDPHAALLNCDLVMKGGITSGVVYPKAVVRLAQRYRIRSIGGTSVGAIAAALTAAAEYWRQTNPVAAADQQQRIAAVIAAKDEAGWKSPHPSVTSAEAGLTGEGNPHASHGYAALYAIPEEIGGNLLGMFQPSGETRGLFNYLISNLNARSPTLKALAAVFAQFNYVRLAAAILATLIALSLLGNPDLAFWIVAPIVAVIILLQAWRVVSDIWRWRHPATIRPIPEERVPADWKRAGAVAGSLLIVAGVVLLIQFGLKWMVVGDWASDGVVAHPVETVAFTVLALIIFGWKWIKLLLTRRLHGDQRRFALHALDLAGITIMIVGALLLGWYFRDWLLDNRAKVGIAGVGFIIGWVAGGMLALAYYLLVAVPENYQGICTGLGNARALTNWLTGQIDQVAGMTDHHLTFGDLQREKIEFEAIASDLKRGVPLDVPRALEHYRFRPCEFACFFPRSVLRQLGVPEAEMSSDTLRGFPSWPQVPVVVTARMSMSFPVLFSAVPVYHISEGDNPARPNWLSDGGIVSNFPLHKFDRALPPWPTFAIDLKEQAGSPPDAMDEQIWLNPVKTPDGDPAATQSGIAKVKEAQAQVATDDLLGLGSRILDTARGWMDNSQKTLPGYAERIVTIHLYPGEGGLNLTMNAHTIGLLADRGMYAAHRLAEAWEPFDPAGHWIDGNQWGEHRWLRYRLLMREVEQLAREWTWVYDPRSATLGPVHHPPLHDLVATNGGPPRTPFVYDWEVPTAETSGRELTGWFNQYATAAGAGILMDAEVPNDANLGPRLFDQARAPALHPKRLMIPPFE
jgi:predicted acylesterase/phospholipase RssA